MNKFWALLERRSLVSKLLLGFGTLLITMSLLGINSILTVREMSRQASELYQKELLGVSHIKEANINLILIGRSLRQLILAPNLSERVEAKTILEQAILNLEKELDEARKSIYREQVKRLLDEFELEIDQYKRNVNHAISLMDDEAEYQGDAIAFISSNRFSQVGDTADQLLNRMAVIKEQGAHETAMAMDRHSYEAQKFNLWLMIAGLLFGVIIALLIGRSIKRPSDQLRYAIDNLAKGNVNKIIPLTDYPNEIGIIARSIEQ